MGASLKLGKVLGIPVSVHFSLVVALFFFTIVFARHFQQVDSTWSPSERWAAGLGTTLLLFFSVLAHELSHSLVAVKRGIPVEGITLFIFGGVAQISREAGRPSTELIVAVVGPISSILLGFLFLALAWGLDGVSPQLSAIAWVLAMVNVSLGLFNMLPGFPLDGGRVLRAVVWRITRNYWKATRLATMGGEAVAFLMISAGVAIVIMQSGNLMSGLWLVILGIFLQMVASASRRQSRLLESLVNYTARDLMTTGCPLVPGDITLDELVKDYVAPSGSETLVLVQARSRQGVITRRSIEQVPRDKRAETWASSVMVPLDGMIAVSPEDGAHRALELMEGRDAGQVLVIENGIFLGYIDHNSLRRFAGTRARSRA